MILLVFFSVVQYLHQFSMCVFLLAVGEVFAVKMWDPEHRTGFEVSLDFIPSSLIRFSKMPVISSIRSATLQISIKN